MWKGRQEGKDGGRTDEVKDSIIYEMRSRGPWLVGRIWRDRTIRVGWRGEFGRGDCDVENRERRPKARLRWYGHGVGAQCKSRVVA